MSFEFAKQAQPYISIAAILLALVAIAVGGRIRDLRKLTLWGITAEFDAAAKNAFDAAADNVWKRVTDRADHGNHMDPDLYFSDADFESAKRFETMMPVWRPLARTKPRARRKIRTLVFHLSDQYRKIRFEPPSDDRTRRLSGVVARMRVLAFAAHPMIPKLMGAERAGERVAAIAFLQVKPCFKESVLTWLGDRISISERRLVQYHAAGALLFACQYAEGCDRKILSKVVCDVANACKSMPKDRISDRALELLSWCHKALERTQHPLGEIIRERAYFIWENEGRSEGRAQEHWRSALLEVLSQEPAGESKRL